MFHTLINLAYILPNIYVFLRIRKLFISKGYHLRFTFIYVLVALIYPISNLFSEGDTNAIILIFAKTGNYLLPVYLYLFLFMLVFDILLFVNYIFKIVEVEKIRNSKFRKIALSTIVFSSIGIVVAGVINFNTIRTSEFNIKVLRNESKIDHLRIAFVADFHLQEESNISFVKRFVKRIENINPDILLFGGDIIEGHRIGGNMIVIEDLLKEIHPKYGVFAVLGNHEYYTQQDKASFFNNAGLKVLCDTIIAIDSSFNLGGRNDSHFKNRKSVDQVMEFAVQPLPTILVDHRPTELNEVSKTQVDIQLSGHTHNGQLFPINLITDRIYKLCWGYKKIGNTHFFVTSGIQLWGPPVRTVGKSEIMVIDVDFTKAEK
jgi:predicted MPP superfamily phosphohydrolase